MLLTTIKDFAIANPLYSSATVVFYNTDAAFNITAVKATLYANPQGTGLPLANPQTLDQYGKFSQPVYISQPVIAQVTSASVPTMTTGVIYTTPSFRVDQATSKLQFSYDGGVNWIDTGGWIFRSRGAWANAQTYNLLDLVSSAGVLYVCITQHLSAGAFDASKFTAILSLDQGALPGGATFQLRRGTTAQIDAITPANGEALYDTTKKTLVAGDGATLGGFPLVQELTYQQGSLVTAVGTGTGDAMAATIVSKVTALVNGMNFRILSPGANAGIVPTLNLTFQTPEGANTATGALGFTKDSNTALLIGDIAGNAHVLDVTYFNAKWRLNNPKLQITAPAAANVAIRQTVFNGAQDANGRAAWIAAGAGFLMNLLATTTPVNLTMAQGYAGAAQDFNVQLTLDQAGAWTLPASNTSYLSLDYASPTSATPTQTLAPFQWSDTYNQTLQSVLQFAGGAGATTFLDDFGSTWAAAGGAKVQATQFKYGTGALGGAGGANALNGTTDYVTSTVFRSLGAGSWSLRAFGYTTSLAAVNTLVDATNAGAFGAQIKVTAAGKVTFNLSSNGTSNDIAAAPVAGAATIVTGAYHFYELTFDALAGVYRMYVDGVQDQTVTSSLKVCAITHINYGGLLSNLTGWVGYIDKPEFLPYCQHPAGTVYVAPTAAPAISVAGYASDWVDITNWTVKSPTAASAVAGTNPTFTPVKRIYVAEGDTSGAAITATRNYAYQRKYQGSQSFPANGTPYTLAHNLGVQKLRKQPSVWLEAMSTVDGGWGPSFRVPIGITPSNTDPFFGYDERNIIVVIPNSAIYQYLPKAGGALATMTSATVWSLGVSAEA